uniref:Uncharacterized protein n=1 Tax=Chromera velia CCMP2878 TaxID=1169474 RepID=A0A0G4HSH4_9ALVE|eukprot:Cvel_31062.t1-p1 / transcript=Cvel_31062.t1 / gene=Cvel_31062 / organism=Chromera_velia_CCMP2878 / gene_product=hypothetical protein / transcript_product=hypothetical protein / location=Cvel_scaffold4553:8464-8748(-) / protein_length=95 / sequence_SO=supercontig / SO=protein_coding / is_pseudo=false
MLVVNLTNPQCPSGCEEKDCLAADLNVYECTCEPENACAAKQPDPVISIVGGILLGAGVLGFLIMSCAACCCPPKANQTKVDPVEAYPPPSYAGR